MIFLTVGHQMPFDRLVRAVDGWARQKGRTDLFGQVGVGGYEPTGFETAATLTPEEFQGRLEEASGVVAHAGTGTIIAALELGKPLLVVPRRADLGETRNDHQIATARHFQETGQVLVASTEEELRGLLDTLESFRPDAALDREASRQLTDRIRAFVFADACGPALLTAPSGSRRGDRQASPPTRPPSSPG